MADISAKLVNELRSKTGLGMMECKKALIEAEGNIETAFDNLRKKGLKASITERPSTEGRVAVALAKDAKTAAIVEVNCTTDFTAKSESVATMVEEAVKMLVANPNVKLSEDPKIKSALLEVAKTTQENVQIGRTAVLTSANGTIGSYLYTTAGKGKIAVLVSLTGTVNDDIVRNLSMHIAAARPVSMTRAEVPADLVAREKDIAVEQAKASGKPQAIAEKIAEGKLNSFFAERVLLDQEFINGEVFKGSVANLLKTKGVTLEKYIRVEVGQ